MQAKSYIDDVPTSTLTDAERTRIRRNEIGFIYQAHHLLNEFTAIENVMLPQMIRGLSRKEADELGGAAAILSRAEGAPLYFVRCRCPKGRGQTQLSPQKDTRLPNPSRDFLQRQKSARCTSLLNGRLNSLLKRRHFDILDLVFAAVQPSRISPEVMLALARVTYPVRECLPHWYSFVRVRRETGKK